MYHIIVKFVIALGVFIVAVLLSSLVGQLLSGVSNQSVAHIGAFLDSNATLIGLIAGIVYFVWGPYPSRHA
jgi:hypothetical protein